MATKPLPPTLVRVLQVTWARWPYEKSIREAPFRLSTMVSGRGVWEIKVVEHTKKWVKCSKKGSLYWISSRLTLGLV